MWRLPLNNRLREQLKSPIADMRNTGDRYGGAITAGLFLKDVRRGHARGCTSISPVRPRRRQAVRPQPKGGTGFAVATIVEYLAGRD